MSKDLTPREVLEAYEAAAFRLSGVARRLLAENPDLPVQDVGPTAGSAAYRGGWATLRLNPDTEDGVNAWARVLGTETETKFYDVNVGGHPFLFFSTKAEVDGVEVEVQTSRGLEGDELELWRSRTRAAEAAPGGGE